MSVLRFPGSVVGSRRGLPRRPSARHGGATEGTLALFSIFSKHGPAGTVERLVAALRDEVPAP